MKRLDTMTTTGPGGTDTLKLTNFPEGFVCAGILLRVTYPIIWPNTSQGPSLAALTLAAFQSLTIRSTSQGDESTPYPTVPGNELRTVARFITRVELPNNIGDFTYTSSGNGLVHFDLLIPFAVEELKDGRVRLPGWSQMRNLTIDIVEGSSLSSGGATRNTGNVTVDVDVLTYPSVIDKASPLLSYYRSNQAALFAELPDGVQLACWEISAAQASTAISLDSFEVGGKKIADTIPPYIAGDKYLLNWDTGVSPITDTVTMGYSPDDGQSTMDLPSGPGRFVQAAQYVATLQVRGLGWPAMGSVQAKQHSINAAKDGPVLASLPVEAEGMPASHARTLPIEFHPAGSPEFTLGKGLLSPGGGAEPYLAIPESTSAVAGAIVDLAGASGAATMAAAQSAQLDAIAKRIPGVAQTIQTGKAPTVSPEKFSSALATIAGEKGLVALTRLRKAVKVHS